MLFPPGSLASLLSVDSQPALSSLSLNLLKWKDEQGRQQTFRLVDRVSSKWKQFGLLLGLEPNQLDALKLDNPGQTAMCWNIVMEHWRKGDSVQYPPTWEGLYTLLEDMEFSRFADELKEAVDRHPGTAEPEHFL